jgi:hypothetical protein
MTKEDFEQQLRTFLRRRPFQPFTVVLTTGERIEVDVPEAVAMGGGAAGYLDPAGEATLFDCEDVSEITAHTPETAS